MQRRSSKLLLLFLTFIMLFSTIAAAPFEAKSLTLLDVRFIKGVGIVLLFDSSGLSKKDLKDGTVDVHSGTYKMSCGFQDDTDVVRCVIKGSLVQYAGEALSGNLAGFAFFGIVPDYKEPQPLCAEDEVVWYEVTIYFPEEDPFSFEIPAEFYDSFAEFITEISDGMATLQITGQFCGEIEVEQEPG